MHTVSSGHRPDDKSPTAFIRQVRYDIYRLPRIQGTRDLETKTDIAEVDGGACLKVGVSIGPEDDRTIVRLTARFPS